jgi:hypothetical protein
MANTVGDRVSSTVMASHVVFYSSCCYAFSHSSTNQSLLLQLLVRAFSASACSSVVPPLPLAIPGTSAIALAPQLIVTQYHDMRRRHWRPGFEGVEAERRENEREKKEEKEILREGKENRTG